MPQRKSTVLVTRNLSGEQIALARNLGLELIVEPALDFEFPPYWDKVLAVVNEHRKAGWVFTSRNGVHALEEMKKRGLQVMKDRQVYAVGKKTKDELAKLGIEAKAPITQDGSHLADLIVNDGEVDSVVYFRGNLSRREMGDKLENAGITVYEVEVYRTVKQKLNLPEKVIDAAVFYSPSAVDAFADSGGFDRELPFLFAIGPTTAQHLRTFTDQGVEVADEPNTETLLRNIADELNSRT